jgi:hypothetical protein
MAEQRGHFREGTEMVHRDAGGGPSWHGRRGCLRRVLHDGYAALVLDRDQPRRSIAQLAGQDDPHDLLPERCRRGAEEGVYCGPAEILLRTPQQPDAVALHDHVQVRRGDIDMPCPYLLPIAWLAGGQGTRMVQQVCKPADARADMQHDQHRRLHVCGKQRCQPHERIHPSGGRSDDDDVAAGHAWTFPSTFLFGRAGMLAAIIHHRDQDR